MKYEVIHRCCIYAVIDRDVLYEREGTVDHVAAPVSHHSSRELENGVKNQINPLTMDQQVFSQQRPQSRNHTTDTTVTMYLEKEAAELLAQLATNDNNL